MNDDGNPNIVEASKGARFGEAGGADPRAAAAKSKPWSIRNAARKLAAMEVDITKPVTPEMMARAFGQTGTQLTMGQLAAIRRFQGALSGNFKFSQAITDDVDGKLVNKEVRAEVSLADLVTGSYDDGDDQESPS